MRRNWILGSPPCCPISLNAVSQKPRKIEPCRTTHNIVGAQEQSCLTKQCLGRRIDNTEDLNQELAAWQAATNADERQVDWQFTAEDARTKLRRLYPQL